MAEYKMKVQKLEERIKRNRENRRLERLGIASSEPQSESDNNDDADIDLEPNQYMLRGRQAYEEMIYEQPYG